MEGTLSTMHARCATKCGTTSPTRSSFSRYLAVCLLLLVGLAVVACGSSATQCDPGACAANNACIAENGETKCRRICSSQFDRDLGCPFNYTCMAHEDSGYCSLNSVVLAEQPAGQWGTSCSPLGGRDANVDCDIDRQFRCYGEGTKDANAYCTRYNCTDDRQCAGGYYCATQNKFPDITRDIRSVRETIRVCKKRTYCDACTSDVDCPQFGARATRCIPDDNGARYCTVECDDDASCNNEAKCTTTPAAFNKVCIPRAGVCVGDGGICTPCKSDANCPNGVCAKTEYSTERFCTRSSSRTCTATDDGDCPGLINGAQSAGCFVSDEPWWQSQCTGFFTLGEDTIAGCWTPSR